MLKPAAALILSGTLALTSLAPSPARANDADAIAKLLLGALVLYGVKEAVDDRNDRRRAVIKQKSVQPWTKRPEVHRPHVSSVITPAKPRAATVPNVRPRARALPAACILTHQTGHRDTRTVFGNRCLKHNYTGYARLPERCFRRFDTVRGQRVGWGQKCLRREGYIW